MAWNGSGKGGASAAPKKPQQAREPLALGKGAVAGVIVVVAAALAAYFLLPGDKPVTKAEGSKAGKKTIVEHVPAVVPVVEQEEISPVTPTKPKIVGHRKEYLNLSEEEAMKRVVRDAIDTPLPDLTNRTYSTQTEMYIDWIFTKEVGEMPVPVPKIPLSELAHMDEIINRVVEIKETDSDQTAYSKEQVAAVKEELKKFLKEGGRVQDFLQYYHDELQDAYMQREEANRQFMEVLKTEPDLAPDFFGKINNRLAERGIKAITVGDRLLKKYGMTTEDFNNERNPAEGDIHE